MQRTILISFGIVWGLLWSRASSFAVDPSSTQPSNQSAQTGTEIFRSVENGDLERVKAILKDNPDLVFRKDDQSGTTALHWASEKEVAELIRQHSGHK